MKHKKSPLFGTPKIFQYVLRGLFTLVFLGVFGVALAENNEEGGKMYVNWMEKIFDTLPTDFATPLTTGTAHQANTLVDANGNFSAIAGVGKLGIGDESVSKTFVTTGGEGTVKASGDNAAIQVSAPAGNPEIQWENPEGYGAVYVNAPTNDLRVWVKDADNPDGGANGVIVRSDKVQFPEGGSVQGHAFAGTFACPMDANGNQSFLKGFDENGLPICSKIIFYDWARNDFGPCGWDGPQCVQSREVYCQSQDGVRVDDSFCFDQPYFPDPPLSKQACPAHWCP